MRDQYVGDLSDMLKYSLLRTLAKNDRRLGVAWYYNKDHDGRTDGHHTEYQQDLRWKLLDEAVWSQLCSLQERSVRCLEQSSIWPRGTLFHGTGNWECVPRLLKNRAQWAGSISRSLAPADLVFLDPDNGVGRAGRRHALVSEIDRLREEPSRAVLLIKFPGMVQFDQQELGYHSLLSSQRCDLEILTLRTSVMVQCKDNRWVPRARWFTLLNPDASLKTRFLEFRDRLNSMPKTKASLRFKEEAV